MRVVTAVINLQFSVAKQCVQWTTVVKTRSQSYHCNSTVIPRQIFPVCTSFATPKKDIQGDNFKIGRTETHILKGV